MEDTNKESIRQFLLQYPDVLDCELRLSSLLQDYFRDDVAQVKRLMKAYQEDIVNKLLKEPRTDFSELKYISMLQQNQDMIEEKAIFVVQWWEQVIDDKIIKFYKKYQSDLKKYDCIKLKIESADLNELNKMDNNYCGVHESVYQSLMPHIQQQRRKLLNIELMSELTHVSTLEYDKVEELLQKIDMLNLSESDKERHRISLTERIQELELAAVKEYSKRIQKRKHNSLVSLLEEVNGLKYSQPTKDAISRKIQEKIVSVEEKDLSQLVDDLHKKSLDEIKALYITVSSKPYNKEVIQKYINSIIDWVHILERKKRIENSRDVGQRYGTRIYSNREIHSMLQDGMEEKFISYLERAPYDIVLRYKKCVQNRHDQERIDFIMGNDDAFDFVKYITSQEVTNETEES